MAVGDDGGRVVVQQYNSSIHRRTVSRGFTG